ncbi:MAG: class I SAM-dependent methyltransferase [Candidatus Sulfotelmatobacter sp.]
MALVKIWRTVRQHGAEVALRKLLAVIPAYMGGIRHWRLCRCRCCERTTIFIARRNNSSEFRVCLFCSANERYELLAAEIRHRYGGRLQQMDVLELDPRSPLKTILSRARTYTRTFYQAEKPSKPKNGAICEDITDLRFPNESFDLIVSSEVLEHVPKLDRAFSETARVLRPGGVHLFTVPPRVRTKKRAEIIDGKMVHIEPPEYHLDPLSREGILAFWDIGPDLSTALSTPGLDLKIVRGPVGESGRVVWLAERLADTAFDQVPQSAVIATRHSAQSTVRG